MNTVPCKGCGKPVLFLKDQAGKWQILDVRAPVFEVKADFTGTKVASLVSENFHVSHFTTCPKANAFSASGRRS